MRQHQFGRALCTREQGKNERARNGEGYFLYEFHSRREIFHQFTEVLGAHFSVCRYAIKLWTSSSVYLLKSST